MTTNCIWSRAALLEALAAGRTLVVDRYAYSGAAFTAAKRLPGLDLSWCQVCRNSSSFLQDILKCWPRRSVPCPAAGSLSPAPIVCAYAGRCTYQHVTCA